MEHLIDAFQAQIKPVMPPHTHIDEDWGQLDYYTSFPPVKFPAVLIDIQSGQFTNDGELRQKGVLTVVVKLYVLRLSNTSEKASQNQKDKAKEGWLMYKNINKALHGQDFLPEGFSTPVRLSMQRVKRSDGVYERDISYTIGMNDSSCMPERPITKPTITIDASLLGI